MIVILYFVEPDVARFDSVKELFFEVTRRPPLSGDVDAPFNPREFISRSANKVETVRMVKVEMTNHCPVFVDATSTKNFI